MPAALHLIGRTFGLLTVVAQSERRVSKSIMWLCRCACGSESLVRGSSPLQGTIRSCGCGISMAARVPRTHGLTRSFLYPRWRGIKGRCLNPNHKAYGNYGGRGIKICEEWKSSFRSFWDDVSPTYFIGAELERIDNNGHYEPTNTKWVDHQTQNRNKRTNHIVTINGTPKTLIEWSEMSGIKANTILTRMRRGWPPERLLKMANSPEATGATL
jgi:hypothetical protein